MNIMQMILTQFNVQELEKIDNLPVSQDLFHRLFLSDETGRGTARKRFKIVDEMGLVIKAMVMSEGCKI